MSQILSREGFNTLRTAWLLLAFSIIAAVSIVAASHWYLESEKREGLTAERRMQEARTRADGARRERENLQESAEVFRTLVDRGLLQTERRLEMIELVNRLRSRHQLFSMDYDIAPQRTLNLAGKGGFNAVDVLASRVKLRVRALHEGDVMDFINDLGKSRQGFYPVDRCTMRRIEAAQADGLRPHVEADCALEWITLREKRAG